VSREALQWSLAKTYSHHFPQFSSRNRWNTSLPDPRTPSYSIFARQTPSAPAAGTNCSIHSMKHDCLMRAGSAQVSGVQTRQLDSQPPVLWKLAGVLNSQRRVRYFTSQISKSRESATDTGTPPPALEQRGHRRATWQFICKWGNCHHIFTAWGCALQRWGSTQTIWIGPHKTVDVAPRSPLWPHPH